MRFNLGLLSYSSSLISSSAIPSLVSSSNAIPSLVSSWDSTSLTCLRPALSDQRMYNTPGLSSSSSALLKVWATVGCAPSIVSFSRAWAFWTMTYGVDGVSSSTLAGAFPTDWSSLGASSGSVRVFSVVRGSRLFCSCVWGSADDCAASLESRAQSSVSLPGRVGCLPRALGVVIELGVDMIMVVFVWWKERES
ncbi:hypothetical protein C8F04DRAFT_709685 [Mycena alexandri]|uniref:Uncharacterized protein n=1 Tax=Mycena alexandri TaxID=1745969 RepID=A0AAD6SNK4_9AGAR|nr:hypothetical protein C8F04DRAFT_709685 [Mycena alexandri]